MSDVTFPTPEEFSDWRRANPTRGVPRHSAHCPFAECLKDRFGMRFAHVWETWHVSNEGMGWRDMPRQGVTGVTPAWAQDWIAAYDRGEEINPPVPAEADVKPGMRLVDGEWAYSAAWL